MNTMWAKQLVAPSTFVDVEVPRPTADDLHDGEVLLHVISGAVCGSDLPVFAAGPHGVGGAPGTPMHEVVGEVVASRHSAHNESDVVVGWASGWNGLAEYSVCAGDGLVAFDPRIPAEYAVALQPLACVLYAVERLTDLPGASVAVLGLGPIGLLFTLVLKSRGCARVVGVDPIDRSGLASAFGIDEFVHANSSAWAASLGSDADRPSVVVEAVGHQTTTFADAVEAVAARGQVYAFGIPDDCDYPLPLGRFLRKHLTLRAAEAFAAEHPGLLERYVTDVVPWERAQEAYLKASTRAPGQIKVVIAMR